MDFVLLFQSFQTNRTHTHNSTQKPVSRNFGVYKCVARHQGTKSSHRFKCGLTLLFVSARYGELECVRIFFCGCYSVSSILASDRRFFEHYILVHHISYKLCFISVGPPTMYRSLYSIQVVANSLFVFSHSKLWPPRGNNKFTPAECAMFGVHETK